MNDRQTTTAAFQRWEHQDEAGVDVSLIRQNLARSPEQRIRWGDVMRRQALHLMEVGRAHRQAALRRVR